MATYDQLYKEFTPNLLQATVNPRAIRDLLVELRPQFAELTFFNETPTLLVINDTPQKITVFDGIDSHNDLLTPDDTTDTITVDAESDGIFGHFFIQAHFDPAADVTLVFELYEDDAPFAQPVLKKVTAHSHSPDWKLFETHGHVSVEPGKEISLYVYKEAAGNVNINFTQINFSLHKVAFGLNTPFPGQILFQTLTAFDPIESVLLQPPTQQLTAFDPIESILATFVTQQLTAFDPIESVLVTLPTQQITVFDPIEAVLGVIPTQQVTVFGPIESVSTVEVSNVSDLQVWMDPDFKYPYDLGNDTVDRSKNRHTVTPQGTGGVPILAAEINGLPAWDYAGADQYHEIVENIDFSNGLTFVAVVKPDTTSGWQSLFNKDDGGGSLDKILWGTVQAAGKWDMHTNNTSNQGSFVQAASSIGTVYEIFAVTLSSAMAVEHFKNLLLDGSGTLTTPILPSPTANLTFGWAEGAGSFLNGKLAYGLVFNRPIAQGEMKFVLNQLKSRFAL